VYYGMLDWKKGKVKGEEEVVFGVRITADTIGAAKNMLTGNPDRIRLAHNHYVVNRGTKENPVFVLIRQGQFIRV
jgi:hypothetical protein